MTETLWPVKSKIFIIWTIIEKVYVLLNYIQITSIIYILITDLSSELFIYWSTRHLQTINTSILIYSKLDFKVSVLAIANLIPCGEPRDVTCKLPFLTFTSMGDIVNWSYYLVPLNVGGGFRSFLFLLFEFIGMTLVCKIIQVSRVQLNKISSTHCTMCPLPQHSPLWRAWDRQ